MWIFAYGRWLEACWRVAYAGDAVEAVLPYTSGKPWMLTEGLAKQDAHSPLTHGLMHW